MRDIADLAQAMASETAELMPRTSAEEILRGGRRRAHRRIVAAAAAATVVAVVVPIGIFSTGGGQNGGLPVGGPTEPETSPSVILEHATPAGPMPDVTRLTPGPRTTPLDPSVGCPDDTKNARAIGETIWTGAKNSGGKDLLARFIEKEPGNTGTAGFAVGLGDRATGRVDNLGCLYIFALPPVAAGYPELSSEFDGPDFYEPDGTTTIISSYVGPVDRITATYDGTPLTVEWARWSEHPDVFVYWILGVPVGDTKPRDIDHPRITIYDAAGNVIARPTW